MADAPGGRALVEIDSNVGFRWWTPRGKEVQIRREEIEARVSWGVVVRWIFVLVAGLGTALGAAELLPLSLDLRLLSLAIGSMVLCNATFSLLLRGGRFRLLTPRGFLVAQALADFVALSVLSYALGTVETPLAVLYLPQVVLLTLLLRWEVSLAMTVVAAALASAPLLLMYVGLLPVLSVFGSDLPAQVTGSGVLSGAVSAGVLFCFLTCWYLVSQVSNGLVLREKRLEQDHKLLTEAARTKTLATLRATHELKAPLAAIKSYIYAMRDGYAGALPDSAQRVVARIGDRCDLLAHRITEIIHLSNLSTLIGGELNRIEADLYDVLQAEVEGAALRGEPRAVQVVLGPRPSGSTQILASDGELRSLLANLLDNAVEYSHPEGEVEVSMSSDEDGIRVLIVDHGIGIPEANVTRVFQDHFRSDNAVAQKANGSGLGLAIVREIARLHGAEVTLASELGVGTQVRLSFPHENPQTGAHDGTHPDH